MPTIPQLTLQNATFNPVVPQFTTYEPIARDINIVQRGLAQKAADYKEANQERNKTNAAWASLRSQMHADEGEWATDYEEAINKQIEQTMDSGSYLSAIETASNAGSNILKDPAVQGRIASNTAYQEEVKRQRDRLAKGEISQDTFDRWTETNPYYHNDVKDASGRIVSGSVWNPNQNFYDDIDWFKVGVAAGQLFKPNVTQGSSETSGPNKDNTMYVSSGGSSSLEEVTPEDLHKTMEGILNTMPNGKDKALQDYQTQIWKYNKLNAAIEAETDIEKKSKLIRERNITLTDLLSDGYPVSEDEYFRRKIIQATDPQAYRKYMSSSSNGSRYISEGRIPAGTGNGEGILARGGEGDNSVPGTDVIMGMDNADPQRAANTVTSFFPKQVTISTSKPASTDYSNMNYNDPAKNPYYYQPRR